MIKEGDIITIAGYYQKVPNPARRWWQVWKPRMIAGGDLAKWRCVKAPQTKP